jgi:NAD dependent epimerase/dehydratase family
MGANRAVRRPKAAVGPGGARLCEQESRPAAHAMNASVASPLPSGLIGHTGFVGGALLRQTRFDACFNSANMAEIDGARFDTLVCAAAPGSMLEANRAPERDKAAIDALIARLDRVEAERFVLVSSIAVLADFAGGDDESTTAFQQTLAYGRHRRALEAFVEQRFPAHLIVRLPALFGVGLRKNFLFDLMNPVPAMLTEAKRNAVASALGGDLAAWLDALYAPDAATGLLKLDRVALNADPRRPELEAALDALGATATQFHHRETTYQYYPTDRLWQDIGIALEAGLTHLHLAPEPLMAADIHAHLTGRPMPETPARLHREDMRTAHAGLWGATGPYQFAAAETLESLAAFFVSQRGGAA